MIRENKDCPVICRQSNFARENDMNETKSPTVKNAITEALSGSSF